MWHFAVTAPPGTASYSAVFEVFVVDTDTGREIPGSSTGPFTLAWTSVPDGRPPLAVTLGGDGQLTVSWPVSAGTWYLESATNLDSPQWTQWSNATASGTNISATIQNVYPQQFFRLERIP